MGYLRNIRFDKEFNGTAVNGNCSSITGGVDYIYVTPISEQTFESELISTVRTEAGLVGLHT